jgi:hypothetical protein
MERFDDVTLGCHAAANAFGGAGPLRLPSRNPSSAPRMTPATSQPASSHDDVSAVSAAVTVN